MFFLQSKKRLHAKQALHSFQKEYADSDPVFQTGWMQDNGGVPLNGKEVERLIKVVPSQRQLRFQNIGFMMFVHFGMNTFYDVEWGSGKENPAAFNPTELDTDQWCRTAKAAGAGGIILTCKHHDGFCLFQTEYTEHSVKNSPWKNGKGDVLADLVQSCRSFNLKVGVYLSPWDQNNKLYGTKAYDDFFVHQLTELLSNYGEIFEVWFDGAKGKDAPDFNYDWDRYYQLIRTLQPDAVISIVGPDVRWCGNEAGICRPSEWNVVSASLMDAEKIAGCSQQDESDTAKLAKVTSADEDLGSRQALKRVDKLIWYPAEVDVSIRKGWFYHKKQDKTVKSLEHLMHIYYSSVGGNASLLLNICPNKAGKIAAVDVERLTQMGQEIGSAFANPVAEQSGEIVFKASYFDLDFERSSPVSKLMLQEDLTKSQRIERFAIYVKQGGIYHKVQEGTTIGSKKIVLFPDYAVDKWEGIRIHILQSRSRPVLSFIGAYN